MRLWRVSGRRHDPTDFDISIPNSIAVVLQENVPFLKLAEALDPLELALLDRGVQLGRIELVLEYPDLVQIVIDPRAAGNAPAWRDPDPAVVPFTGRLDGAIPGSRDLLGKRPRPRGENVIERG